jgi:hypothetical protein
VIRPESGVALAVVLLLLLGLSIVALAGLSGAVSDLAVAAASEQLALAMEAAETGVARTLRSGRPIAAGTVVWPALFPGVTVSSEIRFDPPDPDAPLLEPLPDGDGSAPLQRRHFAIRATAHAGRTAAAAIEQGFHSLWPPQGAACDTEECAAWPVGTFTNPASPVDLGTDPVRTSWRQLDTLPD